MVSLKSCLMSILGTLSTGMAAIRFHAYCDERSSDGVFANVLEEAEGWEGVVF